MRSLLRALILFLALLSAAPASAQIINLDPSPTLPDLGDVTRIAEVAAELEAEAATLIAAREAAGAITRAGIDAQATCRLIAVDLLRAAHRDGPAASPAVVAAMRLADNRRAIDEALGSALARLEAIASSDAEDDQRRIARALEFLRQFNERSLEITRRAELDNPPALDQSLAIAFAPLVEALPLGPVAADRTPWPRTDAAPDDALVSLRPLVRDAPLADDLRAHLNAIIDALERANEFPDLVPFITTYAATVRTTVDVARAIDAAAFLPNSAADDYRTRLGEAVALFREKRTRDIGLRRLDRLSLTAVALRAIAALQLKPDGREHIPAVVSALLAADTDVANDAESPLAAARLKLLIAIVERMVAFRELSDQKLKGELRAAQRELVRACTTAEASLLADLNAIATDPGAEGPAMSDPARATLIAEHAQALEDLQRLSRLNTWIDSIGGIRPAAINGFSNQVKKMSQWLLDPNRRPDAIRAMDHFEQQLDMFLPLPLEMQLRQAEPRASAAAGGRHADLVSEIERLRGQWADAWARADGVAPAANTMLLLYRLTQSLQDLSELVQAAQQTNPATLLNRWGPWQLPPASVAPAVGTIPARLKLAVESALDRDYTALARELDTLDRDVPLAKLIGRLANRLAAELPGDANPAAESLRIIMNPMPSDAILAPQRATIAQLCRYAAELDFARRTGRAEVTQPLHRYVNALADQLLADLGDRRTPIPTLTGFDTIPQEERRRPMR